MQTIVRKLNRYKLEAEVDDLDAAMIRQLAQFARAMRQKAELPSYFDEPNTSVVIDKRGRKWVLVDG